MTRVALPLVVLAAVVLTAGCSGVASDGPPERDRYGVESRVSPSIDESEDPAGEELLPGLTTAGIVDEDAVLDAHDDVVGNRTYTLRTIRLVERENGSDRYVVERSEYWTPNATYGTERRTFEWSTEPIEGVGDARNETRAFWRTADARLERTELENGSVEYGGVRTVDVEGLILDIRPWWLLLRGPSSVDDQSVASLETGDERYYVVDGDGTTDAAAVDGTGSADEAQLRSRVYIRDDGLIRRSVSRQTRTVDGERVTITEAVTVADVGETTVERPEWYDEALEAIDERDEDDDSDELESFSVDVEPATHDAPLDDQIDLEESDDRTVRDDRDAEDARARVD